jgi:integrase
VILSADPPSVHVFWKDDKGLYYLYYVDPVTERRKTRSAATDDYQAAVRAAAAWEIELAANRPSVDQRICWEDARVLFESEHLTGQSRAYRATTRSVFASVERLVDPARPANLSAAVISRYAAALRSAGLQDQTIRTYLKHLRVFLGWCCRIGIIAEIPDLPRRKSPKNQSAMRGRPVTGEEFDRLILAVDDEPACRHDLAGWKTYLRALWWSGLRVDESLRLSWNEIDDFAVIYDAERPFFRIYSDGQKSRTDQLLPVAPEFAEMLHAIPPDSRTGHVFTVLGRSGRPLRSSSSVLRIVSELGRSAAILVDTRKGKHATAHDLRRSFGVRWARRVRPDVLQQMMRHADYRTTKAYYLAESASDLADEIYNAAGVDPRVTPAPESAPAQPSTNST